MIGPWLILFLGGLLHLLTLQGYSLRSAGSWCALVPVVTLFSLPVLKRLLPACFGPLALRIWGLLGFLCAILLAQSLYLEAWDTQALRPGLLVGGAGLFSLLASTGTGEDLGGPGPWFWVAFWMLAGFLDPVLPLLGAALGGMLQGSGILPDAAQRPRPALARPVLGLFLLGLALPKPWWDFGPRPDWAFAGLAFGLGAAFTQLPALRPRLDALPSRLLPWLLGLLAILYWPGVLAPWGFLLGAVTGLLWPRLPRPLPATSLGGAFLGGLVLSFVLHANAWLPGLRHLLWLGN
jgi:hypothetical protein